jgi:hypothetical protein
MSSSGINKASCYVYDAVVPSEPRVEPRLTLGDEILSTKLDHEGLSA